VYVSRPMAPSPVRGRLFVIAAPSGAGKTSLVHALLQRKPELHVSISYTTRRKRPTEEDGREYHFVSVDEFLRLRDQGEFLEHAQVFDNYYGTRRSQVEPELARGNNVILEIDWQGAQQVRRAMPECVTVFILPPSRKSLEERLRNRRTDSDEVIARRLRDAVGDMSHWNEFDYVVINDDFDRAVTDLVGIVEGRGEALRTSRADLQPLVANLLA
jgi:guanylate kinase